MCEIAHNCWSICRRLEDGSSSSVDKQSAHVRIWQFTHSRVPLAVCAVCLRCCAIGTKVSAVPHNSGTISTHNTAQVDELIPVECLLIAESSHAACRDHGRPNSNRCIKNRSQCVNKNTQSAVCACLCELHYNRDHWYSRRRCCALCFILWLQTKTRV